MSFIINILMMFQLFRPYGQVEDNREFAQPYVYGYVYPKTDATSTRRPMT